MQVGGRSLDRSLRPLTYRNHAHATPIREAWLGIAERPACSRTLTDSPLFRFESFEVAFVRCFDRDASSDHRVFFGICTETFVAFAVAFVGVKATFWRPTSCFALSE